MAVTETNLSAQMRFQALARPELADQLLPLAQAFDEATAGFYADPQTVTAMQFLGAYARARMVYCEVTGEPLA